MSTSVFPLRYRFGDRTVRFRPVGGDPDRLEVEW
jgi:hypothetical protein